MAAGGLVIVNTSLVSSQTTSRHDLTELRLPCTELAAHGGDEALVSVAALGALGALVSRLGWVTPDSVRAALRKMAGKKRPEVVEADLGVFEAGLEAGLVGVAAR